MIIRDGRFKVDRPSSLHTWDGSAWVIDANLSHNAPIDAKIIDIEKRNPVSHRSQRELALLMPALFDGLSARFAEIQAGIRSVGAALSNPELSAFTLAPLPDLKTNRGMQNAKAIEDAIAELRAQRIV